MKLIIGKLLWLVCAFLSVYTLGEKQEAGGYRVAYNVEEKIDEYGICKKVLQTISTNTSGQNPFASSVKYDLFVPTQEKKEWEQFIQVYNKNEPFSYGGRTSCFASSRICMLDCPLEGQLNDTGVIKALKITNVSSFFVECSQDRTGIYTYKPQDCAYGRDVEDSSDYDGQAGFSFTRLNKDGTEYSESGDYATEPWGCVKDETTGLVWEVKTKSGTHAWDTLYSHKNPHSDLLKVLVEASNDEKLCGYTDWRVPHLSEVLGLVNFADGKFDKNYFPFANKYKRGGASWWTSTKSLKSSVLDPNAQFFWSYNLNSFVLRNQDKNSSRNYLRLVRGPRLAQMPPDRYITNGDGTVSDPYTGLMWQRCSVGQTWNNNSCSGSPKSFKTIKEGWRDALKEGSDNSFAKHQDWRVPNVKELVSIANYTEKIPAISKSIFPDTKFGYYWTSTPHKNGENIYVVNFELGSISESKSNWTLDVYTRLVRDLPDSGN